ncbi:unnamed protein product [Hyaloperonospora brassicae]|uniref:Uncharacterized protein n=1 Tax=Hyaloperonospora brassicae TaxID=162125 RepID=A0AAV0TDA9_HYABA|nr:unnamed protein product [Hyaloperonospora brassicae]
MRSGKARKKWKSRLRTKHSLSLSWGWKQRSASRLHKGEVTSTVLSRDGSFVFTTSKDSSLKMPSTKGVTPFHRVPRQYQEHARVARAATSRDKHDLLNVIDCPGHIYAEMYPGVPSATLAAQFWGDKYYNPQTRTFTKKSPYPGALSSLHHYGPWKYG